MAAPIVTGLSLVTDEGKRWDDYVSLHFFAEVWPVNVTVIFR